jgi:hypothetical protein
MPFVVYNVRGVLLTPGDTLPDEAFGVFFISAVVKFQVTGNVNDSPAANFPSGKLELEAWKNPSPTSSPSSESIRMLALQVTLFVTAEPSATLPKSTGEVQFKGKLTGAPRQ